MENFKVVRTEFNSIDGILDYCARCNGAAGMVIDKQTESQLTARCYGCGSICELVEWASPFSYVKTMVNWNRLQRSLKAKYEPTS